MKNTLKNNTRLLKIRKVPVILQLEALECGAAALAMVMAYYGKWVPLEQVRNDCGVSRDGSSAKNIYKAAESYGFKVKAYRMTPEALMQQEQFPCILHWNFNHFVVLCGFRGSHAVINDPAKGRVKITMEEFDKAFTGVTLIPVPGDGFVRSGRKKSTLDFARKRLVGTESAMALFALTAIISSVFGWINPVMTRIFLDRIISGTDPDWLMPFVGILTALAAIQLVTAWIQAVYSLKIHGKMAVIGNTSYMWKILSLPMHFFSQRMAGDIQSRQKTNAGIAGTLINTFAPLLLNSIMLVFYLVLMLKQSIILTSLGLGTLLLNIFISAIISGKRVNITRVQQRDAAKLDATTVAGIKMIETIKSSGAEGGFFQKWAGYQASVNTQSVKSARNENFIGSIPTLLSTIANHAVLVIGIWLIMDHQFTLGSLQMFLGFMASFMSPAMTLVNAGQTIQEMRTQMECVEDVMEYPEDENLVTVPMDEHEVMKKLTGKIEIRNITFGYSKVAEPLISDFSMSIKPGSKVAFVGRSGCGKSTLSKLISGLYTPWSGEILFDGKLRKEIPREVMTGSLAVVDQEITLFEGTFADNIKMWDESIEDFEMLLAARDAQIHDEIMSRMGGYQYRITSGGRDLSGGQRQRLEIARVLAQDPSILILDEATSALDTKTEADLIKAITDRGITCIMIAHRLSTIRDCDEIVVLDNGHVIERGTHDSLMALNGTYTELISNA